MVNLQIGKVYLGKIHKELVIYEGYEEHEEGGWYHQFTFVKEKPVEVGYGQTTEQVLKENYKLKLTESILYGQK